MNEDNLRVALRDIAEWDLLANSFDTYSDLTRAKQHLARRRGFMATTTILVGALAGWLVCINGPISTAEDRPQPADQPSESCPPPRLGDQCFEIVLRGPHP